MRADFIGVYSLRFQLKKKEKLKENYNEPLTCLFIRFEKNTPLPIVEKKWSRGTIQNNSVQY